MPGSVRALHFTLFLISQARLGQRECRAFWGSSENPNVQNRHDKVTNNLISRLAGSMLHFTRGRAGVFGTQQHTALIAKFLAMNESTRSAVFRECHQHNSCFEHAVLGTAHGHSGGSTCIFTWRAHIGCIRCSGMLAFLYAAHNAAAHQGGP